MGSIGSSAGRMAPSCGQKLNYTQTFYEDGDVKSFVKGLLDPFGAFSPTVNSRHQTTSLEERKFLN